MYIRNGAFALTYGAVALFLMGVVLLHRWYVGRKGRKQGKFMRGQWNGGICFLGIAIFNLYYWAFHVLPSSYYTLLLMGMLVIGVVWVCVCELFLYRAILGNRPIEEDVSYPARLLSVGEVLILWPVGGYVWRWCNAHLQDVERLQTMPEVVSLFCTLVVLLAVGGLLLALHDRLVKGWKKQVHKIKL